MAIAKSWSRSASHVTQSRFVLFLMPNCERHDRYLCNFRSDAFVNNLKPIIILTLLQRLDENVFFVNDFGWVFADPGWMSKNRAVFSRSFDLNWSKKLENKKKLRIVLKFLTCIIEKYSNEDDIWILNVNCFIFFCDYFEKGAGSGDFF